MIKFPKTPTKPIAYYRAFDKLSIGSSYVAVCLQEDKICFYLWDGYSLSYNQYYFYPLIKMKQPL